jgi:hypothetical protein
MKICFRFRRSGSKKENMDKCFLYLLMGNPLIKYRVIINVSNIVGGHAPSFRSAAKRLSQLDVRNIYNNNPVYKGLWEAL